MAKSEESSDNNNNTNKLNLFLKTGIYRLDISNSVVFIDPVRVLNRSYSHHRVSPSAYYSRFFQSKQSQTDDVSRSRKRKKIKPKILNHAEQLAHRRHQDARPLLLMAHEALLGATAFLATLRNLRSDFDDLYSPRAEKSFVELPRVCHTPLYESLFDPKEEIDLAKIHNLIPAESDHGFNLILIDPPWENGSARQKMKYPTLPNRYFLSLPVKQLTHAEGALVALWITNREKLRIFVENELFPSWGVIHVATHYWLKVKPDGSLIGDLDLFHHRPYECLLVGYHQREGVESNCLSRVKKVPDNQIVISIPGDYSRKPPIGELLLEYVPGSQPVRSIELFAREMVAGWTSWGNEPLHFQESSYFSRISEKFTHLKPLR